MRAKLLLVFVIFWVIIPATLSAQSISNEMKSESSDNKIVYDIQSQIYVDQSLVSSPRIFAQAGKIASISLANKENSSSLKIDLLAKEIPNAIKNGEIKISYNIKYRSKAVRVDSKPVIIVMANQAGLIKLSTDSGHLFEMRVLAKRVAS